MPPPTVMLVWDPPNFFGGALPTCSGWCHIFWDTQLKVWNLPILVFAKISAKTGIDNSARFIVCCGIYGTTHSNVGMGPPKNFLGVPYQYALDGAIFFGKNYKVWNGRISFCHFSDWYCTN